MRTFESKLSVSATLYLNKIYSTEKIRKQLYFVWKIIFRVILDSAKHFNILCAAGLVLRPQAAVGQQVCERELVPALAPVPAPAGLPLQDGQPAAHGPGGRELLLPLRHEVLLHRQGAQRRHPRYSDFINYFVMFAQLHGRLALQCCGSGHVVNYVYVAFRIILIFGKADSETP